VEKSSTSSSSQGPRLVVASQPEAPQDESPPADSRKDWGLKATLRDPRLALAVLLGIALLALLAQSWRAQQLSGQVGALENRLEAAQQLIERHEVHLQRVQGSVGSLLEEVRELDRLVKRSPGRREEAAGEP